jgi:hypothetical protein
VGGGRGVWGIVRGRRKSGVVARGGGDEEMMEGGGDGGVWKGVKGWSLGSGGVEGDGKKD